MRHRLLFTIAVSLVSQTGCARLVTSIERMYGNTFGYAPIGYDGGHSVDGALTNGTTSDRRSE